MVAAAECMYVILCFLHGIGLCNLFAITKAPSVLRHCVVSCGATLHAEPHFRPGACSLHRCVCPSAGMHACMCRLPASALQEVDVAAPVGIQVVVNGSFSPATFTASNAGVSDLRISGASAQSASLQNTG